jgi:hypothetical protein
MRTSAAAAISMLALATIPVRAQPAMHSHNGGPAHSHSAVDRTQAEAHAQQIMLRMITRGIVEGSWRNVPPETAEIRQYATSSEWVVTFRNNEVADPAKRVIYVFLTQTGDYVAANYTGR